MTTAPLRLMFYDKTCRGPWWFFGLTHAWMLGGILYRFLGRIDAVRGVSTWSEALDWLNHHEPTRTICEIQFWGHGEWGGLWMEEDLIKIDVLEEGHALYGSWVALKNRLVSDGTALFWFRCCDTFGAEAGQDFARRWTSFFECSTAGHTYTINFLQSGLQVLQLGEEPNWPIEEGIVPGLEHASESGFFAPRTITCLQNEIPGFRRGGDE